MAGKKWAAKRIALNITEQESQKLEAYCEATGRTQTEVIRELIRNLRLPRQIPRAANLD